MRKIKLYIASSLDSYIARENGKIDWLFSDEDYGYAEFYDSIDTILVGRKTYDQSLKFDTYPYHGKTVYVFTRNNGEKANKNYAQDVKYIDDEITGFARSLTQQSSDEKKDIWLVGGGEIVSIMLSAQLVDQIILSVHPIILGKGIPLFNNIKEGVNLRLQKSIPFRSGLVQLYYYVLKIGESTAFLEERRQ
ncbi:MAG TPA: dihydrofolate reductase family protein [Nitrososphaera sp.]|nr:dihydrofolate reductase family protein [Nitrososphaera sp.]